jgi:hypothetical protein
MRKYQLHLCAFVLLVSFQLSFDLTAAASPWLSSSLSASLSSGSTSLLTTAKTRCEKVFVCDYFAPATSCSAPPCCKKGHWEKNCEKQSQGNPPAKPCAYEFCHRQCELQGKVTNSCIKACLPAVNCKP